MPRSSPLRLRARSWGKDLELNFMLADADLEVIYQKQFMHVRKKALDRRNDGNQSAARGWP
jgi:hypothetical protein